MAISEQTVQRFFPGKSPHSYREPMHFFYYAKLVDMLFIFICYIFIQVSKQRKCH